MNLFFLYIFICELGHKVVTICYNRLNNNTIMVIQKGWALARPKLLWAKAGNYILSDITV